MLVLSRDDLESVVITCGDKVMTLTVLEARNGRARLGFQAPRDFKISREELLSASDQRAVGLPRSATPPTRPCSVESLAQPV